jgi:hypothetical protein
MPRQQRDTKSDGRHVLRLIPGCGAQTMILAAQLKPGTAPTIAAHYRRFCCKLSWRAERGLAAGFGQAAHWNSSATKAA